MQALYRLVARVMNTDLPVLITGESGTGKSADRARDP
jgi:two-component system nitrogen regulation response regulator GlnG